MEWDDNLNTIKGVGPKKAAALLRLGLSTVYDIMMYYPRTYIDQSKLTRLDSIKAGCDATIMGYITNVSERRASKSISILTASVSDGTGYISLVWFNQPFLKKNLSIGNKIIATGRIDYAFKNHSSFQMNRILLFELLGEDNGARHSIIPVYSSTSTLNQKFFRKILQDVFDECPVIHEVIPKKIIERYNLMGRDSALHNIHFPDDEESLKKARERLAFEELYIIQCGLFIMRRDSEKNKKGIRHLQNSNLIQSVYDLIPFRLTDDQIRTWQEIAHDMENPAPMRRLVQGDVGSGKTIIAMLALVKTVENGYQGALMAPTEILARQHFETFCEMLKGKNIRIGFISGSLTAKEHQKIIDEIASHDVDIVIGTHALIQNGVQFASLGLVVTDEQHRFGIGQRAALTKMGGMSYVPDILVMTATPIPRTMTLTVYGDLSVSRIEQLPPGRKPIRTFVRPFSRRPLIYEFIKKDIISGRQAYVVCPLIDENEQMDLSSAEKIYEELSGGIFNGIECGLLHGKLKAKEKEKVMALFYEGKIKLLVSTTVIEVGVNVPNASIMAVENAERFGLAQLHQLRGRIGRGEYNSFCILITGHDSSVDNERLSIMEKTANGFELAEEDLRLRGPGQFFGSMQHGLGDLRIANVLRDTEILMKARKAARETMEHDDSLRFIKRVLELKYKKNFSKITDT